MEKEIGRLLNCLRIEYGLFWIASLVLVSLYEWDILPQGVLAGDARMEYMLEVAGILMAVALIPLSLRLFSLSLTRYVRRLALEQALKSYRRWNEVRIALLAVPALLNLSVYYWTLDTTGLLCGGMVLVAALFCIPTRERLLDELDLHDVNP